MNDYELLRRMLSHLFVSNVRKFTRVPHNDVYISLLFLLQTDLDASVESCEEKMLMKARLKGLTKQFGFTVQIRIFPENEATTIELSFSYWGFLAATLALLIGIVILSIALSSMIPLLGLAILYLLIHNLSSASAALLRSLNDFLLLLERDRDQRLLAESRRRWQVDPRRTDDLYRKLVEKHVKAWGDSDVLEYKINEYVRSGLTSEEAVRKTAEEEGIF